MAPTKITRSVARKNGATFHSLDAGVHKTFQCIISDKRHVLKAALSHHFKTHNTRPEELSPFVHPSCWDEKPLTSYPPSKEGTREMTVESNVFDSLPSRKQRAINAKITCALAGVKTKKQLQRNEDQTSLSLLHWWFRANEGSLRAQMEFGPEGLFPRQGECKLQNEGQEFYINGITAEDDSLLELADAPPMSQLEPLSAGNTPTTQADNLVSNPDQAAYTDSAQTGFYNHDFDRSLRARLLRTSSSHRLAHSPVCRCYGA